MSFLQCEWAERMGIDLCFIVAENGTDYCGGTEEGRNYLVKNPHLPKSFVASLNHCKCYIIDYVNDTKCSP